MLVDVLFVIGLGAILAWTSREHRASWPGALRSRWTEVQAWLREVRRNPLWPAVAALLLCSLMGWGVAIQREGLLAFTASKFSAEGRERRACFEWQAKAPSFDDDPACPVGGGRYGYVEEGYGCPIHGVAPP